jgi:two-component system nitrogen regulation response regulator GlnG
MSASELFGHRRGAFTGATDDRKGYFALAEGGSLFLDEIGEVTLEVQALLLRAVEQRVVQPIGGSLRSIDVRLIAATDSDLERAIERREFREPLLQRFKCDLRVPPLRARRDDVGLLFVHLLREQSRAMGDSSQVDRSSDAEPFIPARFVAALALRPWSGNVRELSNVALRFAVENRGRARGGVTEELWSLVRTAPRAAKPAPPSLPRADDLTDEMLLEALRAENFNRERAAKRLQVSKSYYYERLAAHGRTRHAAELPAEEIAAAVRECGGDWGAAAARLEVSPRALKLQRKRVADKL